jgi:hypothetical protein
MIDCGYFYGVITPTISAIVSALQLLLLMFQYSSNYCHGVSTAANTVEFEIMDRGLNTVFMNSPSET